MAKEAYAATVASIIQAISPDLIAAMQADNILAEGKRMVVSQNIISNSDDFQIVS